MGKMAKLTILIDGWTDKIEKGKLEARTSMGVILESSQI